VEQGSKGKGHMFESCRVRQESMCRACRDLWRGEFSGGSLLEMDRRRYLLASSVPPGLEPPAPLVLHFA